MKADLVELGVPQSYITCDYAGFRTLDSIVRAKDIFGQNKFIVISQQFHCERAIYLGRKMGCDIYGYCANDVSGWWHLKVRTREIFARCKTILDLILNVKPKYLGEPVAIELGNKK